jgi:hypothetical protein
LVRWQANVKLVMNKHDHQNGRVLNIPLHLDRSRIDQLYHRVWRLVLSI